MLEMLISWSEMRIIVTLVVGLENGWLCPVFQTVLVARLDTCSWVCPSVPVSQSVLLCHHALAQVTQGQGGGPRPADCWCRGIRCEGGDKTRSLNIPWSDPSQGIQCLVSCSGGVHPSPAQWGPLDELIKELLIETLTTGMIITLTGHTWHLTRRR